MEYSPDEAKALRDGRAQKVHAVELVPGDVITLAVGDKVPADSRVISISSASFTVDQALLTGESYSVSKSTGVVKDEQAVKQDMTNMLFSVSSHTCRCKARRALPTDDPVRLHLHRARPS